MRLRSKQHLLDTLVERARDQNAYTRARVMQTWASLAVSRCIDMGHWLCVSELAVGESYPGRAFGTLEGLRFHPVLHAHYHAHKLSLSAEGAWQDENLCPTISFC